MPKYNNKILQLLTRVSFLQKSTSNKDNLAPFLYRSFRYDFQIET